jgi:predicted phosphohydrolase
VLVLGGDVGTGSRFGECLALFADLSCRKALIPGNHDVWVPPDAEADSLHRYEQDLPQLAAANGFHYLDQAPLILPEAQLALVGSINWYDYSWAQEAIRRLFPAEEDRLASKRFTRGRHNDANFVRWPLDDPSFTARVVTAFERQLTDALSQVPRAIVITHHPAIYELGFPHAGQPMLLDSYLWDAFCGNARLESFLVHHAEHVPLVFSGHTHRARSTCVAGMRGFNVGGDYHFKRLLCLDWPEGKLVEHQFGDPLVR